jgi:hypothetical protein
MFCDLVGSTMLSEQLDPEDVGELVLEYQEMGRAVVARFGGSVAQYLGDGLLTHFGYPVAHEDDAERAVCAGLAILSNRSRALTRRPTSTAFGWRRASVSTRDRSSSARWEAPTGRTRRCSAAHRRPIRVWSVAGMKEAPALRRRAPDSVPLVGRQSELATMLECVERSRRGDPQTMLLMGEPGVGKSRLVQALFDDTDDSSRWLEFRCSELAAASPLQPVVAGLRRLLGVAERDSPAEQLAKLEQGLAVLRGRARDVLPYVADLLGIESTRAKRWLISWPATSRSRLASSTIWSRVATAFRSSSKSW